MIGVMIAVVFHEFNDQRLPISMCKILCMLLVFLAKLAYFGDDQIMPIFYI